MTSGRCRGRSSATGADVGPASTALANECRTGADANAREDCRILGYINSVQAYWKSEFASAGSTYEPAGPASSPIRSTPAAGSRARPRVPSTAQRPHVYIDLGFFNDLRTKFGATGGPLAEAYVLAHEYGHHVQDL